MRKIGFIIYSLLTGGGLTFAHGMGGGYISSFFLYSVLILIIGLVLFGMWKNILIRYLILYTAITLFVSGLFFALINYYRVS